MKAVRLENFGTKTPPGKSAEEWRRKKKNLTNTGWSSAPAESGETGGKDTGAAGTPPERRPTYSETMQGYYGDRYADALAENKTAADAAAETAERDAQDALERIRGGYKSTGRQLYREYMESKRTLPQRLAAHGITGGLTESSQVRLANSYGEELAENERARLAEEAKTYSARDARLAAARAEQSRADAEAKRTHGESLAKLWQGAEKRRREEAAKAAALLAAAGDYSGYVGVGLTQDQADYLSEIWMGRNDKVAQLRRTWGGGRGSGSSGSALADTLSETLLLNAERGADAAVEYIAAQLASGAIRSDEAEEIWKLLRVSGESDI